MATKLNIGKETRKKYKEANEKYNEAIVAKNEADKSIEIYFEGKIKEASEFIGETTGSTTNMLSMLEKDSRKREDYEKMKSELESMQGNIRKLK